MDILDYLEIEFSGIFVWENFFHNEVNSECNVDQSEYNVQKRLLSLIGTF